MYIYTWHFRINIFGSAEGSKRSSFWKVPNSWADIWICLEWVRERENQVWKSLRVITQYLFYSFPFALENSMFLFNFNFLIPKTFCVGVQPINIVELLKQSPKFQVNNSNFFKIVYIWLYCVFIAAHGLSLVAASRGYAIVVMHWLLIVMASLVAEHRL